MEPSLRDTDRTLANDRAEVLLRENGDLSVEVAKRKAMYTTEKNARGEMPRNND